MKRLRTRLTLAVLLLGLLLTGCPEEGNTITFWVMPNADTEPHQVWLEKKKSEFLQSEGIIVNYEIINWADAFTKIKDALQTGTGPDVIQIRSTWNAYFARRGGLKELKLNEYGGEDSFLEGLVRPAEYEDACYGVPWFGETALLFCDDTTLHAVQATPPRTLDDLFTLGEKIIAAGRGAALSLPGFNADEIFNYWTNVLYACGGDFLSDDLTVSRFYSQEGIRALDAYVKLYKKGIVPKNLTSLSLLESEQFFFSGQSAMCFLTPRGVRRAESQAAFWPAVAFPPMAATGGGRSCYAIGSHLTIPSQTRYPVKASRWIAFLLKDENLVSYGRDVCAVLPAKKRVLASDAFSAGFWPQFREALESVKPYPSRAVWLDIEGQLIGALRLALLSSLKSRPSPSTNGMILKNTARIIDQALAREK